MSAIQSENGNIGTNFAPGTKTRVIFADDHKIFRQALVGLIEGKADIHLVGEASNGEEAVDLARKFNPDVIVMDISMPRMNGVEATRQIKTELPSVRVVVLSMYQDKQIARIMIEAGAEAFLTKSVSSAELLQAIRG